jgi:hypothetical protein
LSQVSLRGTIKIKLDELGRYGPWFLGRGFRVLEGSFKRVYVMI